MPNLYQVLQGMDPEDAEQFMGKIEQLLNAQEQERRQAESGEFQRGMVEAWERSQGQTRSITNLQQQEVFTAQSEARLNSLSAEYERLSKEPSKHGPRMDAIAKEIQQLDGLQRKHEAQQATERRQLHRPEMDVLQSDINNLAGEIEKLSKNPSAHMPRIEALEKEIKTREQRYQQLESGDTGPSLQWSGQ